MSAYLVVQHVDFKEFNGFSPVHYGLCLGLNGRHLEPNAISEDLNGPYLAHCGLFADLNDLD